MATTSEGTTGAVGCPSLLSNEYDEKLIISSFSHAVGTTVEFLCADDNEVLNGPGVLQCMPFGRWNGTVPDCVNKSDLTTSSPTSLSTDYSVSPELATTSAAESEVETVLVILWVSGGLLLITLCVLLICILRSHTKGRRNSRHGVETTSRDNPRHGGVNPTFSNYDEIWTWIPVVRNTSDQCRPHGNGHNPVAHVVSSNQNQRNRELLNNLRLPSYNEAMGHRANNRTSNNRTQNVPNVHHNRIVMSSSHVTSSSNAYNPIVRAQRSINNNNPAVQSNVSTQQVSNRPRALPIVQNRNSHNSINASNNNQTTNPLNVTNDPPYDIIPADTALAASFSSCAEHVSRSASNQIPAEQHVTHTSSNHRSGQHMPNSASNQTTPTVAVTSASGSALEEARNFIRQMSVPVRQLNSPIKNTNIPLSQLCVQRQEHRQRPALENRPLPSLENGPRPSFENRPLPSAPVANNIAHQSQENHRRTTAAAGNSSENVVSRSDSTPQHMSSPEVTDEALAITMDNVLSHPRQSDNAPPHPRVNDTVPSQNRQIDNVSSHTRTNDNVPATSRQLNDNVLSKSRPNDNASFHPLPNENVSSQLRTHENVSSQSRPNDNVPPTPRPNDNVPSNPRPMASVSHSASVADQTQVDQQNPCYSSEVRQASYMLYPAYSAGQTGHTGQAQQRQQQLSTDFRHSNGSVFAYYCENGSRIRTTIPVNGEAPPPYTSHASSSHALPAYDVTSHVSYASSSIRAPVYDVTSDVSHASSSTRAPAYNVTSAHVMQEQPYVVTAGIMPSMNTEYI